MHYDASSCLVQVATEGLEHRSLLRIIIRVMEISTEVNTMSCQHKKAAAAISQICLSDNSSLRYRSLLRVRRTFDDVKLTAPRQNGLELVKTEPRLIIKSSKNPQLGGLE